MKRNIKIKIIGGENIDWAIDKNKKSTEYFFGKIQNTRIVNKLLTADIYYILWYNQILNKEYFWTRNFIKIYKKLFGKKIIATVTNDIRWFPERFVELDGLVDLWIVYSDKTLFFLKERNAKTFKMPSYFSAKVFFNLEKSKIDIARELKIDFSVLENKILIGSFQRDSLSGNVRAPRWEKDPDLLIDICLKLPREKFILILAGPLRHYLIYQCKKYNIPYLFVGDEKYITNEQNDMLINNLPKEKMNLLYNLIDVYIVSSKIEGGPKAVPEACLAKTLIFSTDVGLASEHLEKSLIYSAHDLSKVLNCINNWGENKEKTKEIINKNYHNAINFFNEDNFINLYEQLIEEARKK